MRKLFFPCEYIHYISPLEATSVAEQAHKKDVEHINHILHCLKCIEAKKDQYLGATL